MSRTSRAASAALLASAAAMLGGCSVLSSLPGLFGGGEETQSDAAISPMYMVEVKPDPGRATVKPMKASWCRVVPPEDLQGVKGRNVTWHVEAMVQDNKGPWEDGPRAARSLCAAPDEPSIQQQTAYYVQYWVNLSGGSIADVEKFLLYYANDGRWAEGRDMACTKLKTSNESSKFDQETAAGLAEFFGCGYAPSWVYYQAGYIERALELGLARPPEPLLALNALRCSNYLTEKDEDDALAYAACRADIAAVNPAKLERELAPYGEWAQIQGRLVVSKMKMRYAKAEAIAREMAKEDPAWKTLLFDAPEQGRKAWHETYAANKTTMDEAAAFLKIADGPRKSATAGCMSATWKNLSAYVTSKKPKTTSDVRRLMEDPVGHLSVQYVRACLKAIDAFSSVDASLRTVDDSAPPWQGPRAAASIAITRALAEIRRDRTKFLETNRTEAAWLKPERPSPSIDRGEGATVKAVTKKDGVAVVEFKAERWQAQLYTCRSTGQVIGYNDDGTPRYKENCFEDGKEWKTEQKEAIKTPAELTGGIKPGVVVRTYGDMPIEVWASKSQKKLVAYLGIPLS